MANATTGDFDFLFELSEHTLTAILSQRLVGVQTLAGATLRVSKVEAQLVDKVEAQAGPGLGISVSISHGTYQQAFGAHQILLRGLAVRLDVKLGIALVHDEATGQLSLQPEPRRLEVALAAEPWAEASLDRQCLAQTPVGWQAVRAMAVVEVNRALRAGALLGAIPLDGLVFNPAADAFPKGLPFSVRQYALVAQPRVGSKASMLAVGVCILGGHQGNVAHKTDTLTGPAGDVALAISAAAIQDGLLCPRMATVFKMERKEDLCPVCGTGTVSLKSRYGIDIATRVDMTRMDISFPPTHIDLRAEISGEAVNSTISGSLTLGVTIALQTRATGQFLVPTWLDPRPDIKVDTNDLIDVLSLGAIQAIANGEVPGIVKSKVNAELAKHPLEAIALPAELGGVQVIWTTVALSPDGVVVLGRLAAAARVLPPIQVSLKGAVSRALTRVGSGTAGTTCRGSDYAFDDYDAEQTTTMLAWATGFEHPERLRPWRWYLAGVRVTDTGGRMDLPATNTGEGPDAQDGSVKVHVGATRGTALLTFRNEPADGNYALLVVAEIEDDVDVYRAFDLIEVDGQIRKFDRRYFFDLLRCAREVAALDRHIRWPVSDPAGWEYPAAWEAWFRRPIGPPIDPAGGPASLFDRWLVPVLDGVMRSPVGEQAVMSLLPPEAVDALVDRSAFRSPAREVMRPVERPIDERPVDERPIDERPVDERPVDERPVDERPVDERPVDEQPVDERPFKVRPLPARPGRPPRP